MEAKFEKTNETFDVKISLTAVTKDVYNDIMDYIEKRIRRSCEDGTWGGPIAVEREGTEDTEPAADICEGTEILEPKKQKKPTDERLSRITDLFRQYKEHPERFVLKTMSSEEFLKTNPEYEGISIKSLSKKLQHLGIESSKKRGVNYYQFPIPTKTIAAAIQDARREAGMTREALSLAIGYGIGIVAAWEKGTLTPSREAVGLLKKTLGNDIFKEVYA